MQNADLTQQVVIGRTSMNSITMKKILKQLSAVTKSSLHVAKKLKLKWKNPRKPTDAIDFQIINYTRLEGEIRVRRTERYAVEDFD